MQLHCNCRLTRPIYRILVIARPHWRVHHRMKLKLGLLKYFTSVEKLVFRSLKCTTAAIPIDVIASRYTRLTSLTINNCIFRNHSDETQESWIKAIAGMTQLKKLDLDCQEVTGSSYNHLIKHMTHLTQLRVSAMFNRASYGVPKGLKKLS